MIDEAIEKINELCVNIVVRLSNEDWDSYDAESLFDISKTVYGHNDSDVENLEKF